MSTELDTSVVRQKYITNQVLDKDGRTPLCSRCALDTGASSECRAQFDIIWAKELAEAEIASRVADSIPSGPDAREVESFKSTEATGQPVTMEEVNTDQFVERDGGASRQLDENQLQPRIKMLQQLLQSKEQQHN